MASTIKLKNGSGAPLASDLVQGEPALDLTNKRLYTEDSGGTVIEVGTNPSTITIPGGTIDNTVIGGTTTAAGSFTTLQADTSLNVDGTVTADGLDLDGVITADATDATVTLTGTASASVILQDTGASTNQQVTQLLNNGGDFVIRSLNDTKTGLVANAMTIENLTGNFIFNEDGNDADFRVESDTKTHALFVQGSNGNVGIGYSAPVSTLSVNGDILSAWGNTGQQRIGINANTSNVFTITEKTFEVIGADGVAGSNAMRGGDVVVRGGHAQANVALGATAGNVYIKGGEHLPNATTDSGGYVRIITSTKERLGAYHGSLVINQDSEDYDFRVESDSNTHAFFVRGSDGNIGIGTSGPKFRLTGQTVITMDDPDGTGIELGRNGASAGELFSSTTSTVLSEVRNGTLFFRTNNTNRMEITGAGDFIFNEDSADADFRVESDVYSHSLFVDGANGCVGVGQSDPGGGGVSSNDAGLRVDRGLVTHLDGNVGASGTLDFNVNTSGAGFHGFLTVSGTVSSNRNFRTMYTYSLFGRGTDCVATLIASDNGSSGGVSVTLSFPSNGVVRLTNNTGYTGVELQATFFGAVSL